MYRKNKISFQKGHNRLLSVKPGYRMSLLCCPGPGAKHSPTINFQRLLPCYGDFVQMTM